MLRPLKLAEELYNRTVFKAGIFMPKASDLKKGDVVQIDNVPHVVKQLDAKSPSARGASTLYKIKFENLVTGQKRDESLKGDDFFETSDFSAKPGPYSHYAGTS